MKKRERIIYFTNGSVGDFLMALFFADLIAPRRRESVSPDAPRSGVKGDTAVAESGADDSLQVCIRIITPRDAGLLKGLSARYPVTVTECNSRTIRGLFNCLKLLPSMFRSNTVVVPLPLESVSSGTRMFAKALSLFKGSELVGFEDNEGKALYPDMIISLVARLGFTVDPNAHEQPRLRFKRDQAVLGKYALIKEQYVVLHPCGSNLARTLSADEMTAIIRLIHEKSPSLKIVLTGSAKDRAYIEASVGSTFRSSGSVVDLAGKLSMNELENAIENSCLFIGVDTGITHIACMIGAKSLVISHSASLLQWLPYYNSNARIVYNVKDCSHRINEGFEHLKQCYDEESKYLLHVPIGVVLKALTEMLKEKRNMG